MHIKYSEQSILGLEKVYQDCRVYIVDSYLIFYTIQESAIIIRRILNSAVNYTRKNI